MRALLLTQEETTVASFKTVCSELGIGAEAIPSMNEIASRLAERKYAAVVVDFDNPDAAQRYLPSLRESRMNKSAVVIAVATNTKNLVRALDCRAHFVLRRPLALVEVRRTLRASYDLMIANHRRQFRCSIVLPARVRMLRSGAAFECSTLNISSNGIAVHGSMRMKQFDSVDLDIVLPDGFVVLASGIVVWEDTQGKYGINFQVRTPEIRQKLDSWLSAQEALIADGEPGGRDFSEILPHTKRTTSAEQPTEAL
ncbi:MAG TPA: PilZ domain-containing protein [Terriglobales bacterium]|nr:PilZ domain-containing protein [Terriglobales bacterium]